MTDLVEPATKARVAGWFEELRDRLAAAFEAIEDDGPGEGPCRPFRARATGRAGRRRRGHGILRGRVLEKAGVNVSIVEGEFSEAFRARIPGAAEDRRFWASGISVVAHPRSPLVPAAHMNTRMIVTRKRWFGGGADLTPVFPDADDSASFHAALRAACDRADPGYYPRFKAWCDEYFYPAAPGRAARGGRDLLRRPGDRDLEADLPSSEPSASPSSTSTRASCAGTWTEPWTAEQKRAQLIKRGRYVEFNLLYDRGTRFGIETGGNPEAVLMSLPPEAAWP